MLLLVAGCATRPKTPATYTVFPLPPDEPRIQFLTSFGSETDLGGQDAFQDFIVGSEKYHRPIWKPYGIAARPGRYFICDTQPGSLVTVDLKKRRLAYCRPEGQAAMKMPINVAVDADGTRYVTDTGRGQVLLYSPENTLIAAIGKKDEIRPSGIALWQDRILVTDLKNSCVRVYDKTSRELKFTFPENGKEDTNRLFQPTNIAVDRAGRIFVSDSGGFNLKVYDSEGRLQRVIGDQGLLAGYFALPKGIGVDHEGRIFVVDAATAVGQVFDHEGRLLMFFGEPKSSGPGAMYLPASLAIDYDNVGLFSRFVMPGYKVDFLILVTNQAGPQKVNVYGFLRKT